jgi:hypothetical protein
MPGELEPDWPANPYTGMREPPRITVADFRRYFLQNFPKVSDAGYDPLIQDAIDTVYSMFAGINTLWDMHGADVWRDKTRACYRLLTAWYVADMNPALVAGMPVMAGGMPLKRKRIDGVDLVFGEAASVKNAHYEDLLESLLSNPWGVKARMMIKTAAKRVMLRNHRFV